MPGHYITKFQTKFHIAEEETGGPKLGPPTGPMSTPPPSPVPHPLRLLDGGVAGTRKVRPQTRWLLP
jgi:hypothetical protein